MQPVFQLFQYPAAGGHRTALGVFFRRTVDIAIDGGGAGENDTRDMVRQGAVDDLLHRLQVKRLTRAAAPRR